MVGIVHKPGLEILKKSECVFLLLERANIYLFDFLFIPFNYFNIKKMGCGHDQMLIQSFIKMINGFKSTHDVMYFLLNCLLQIKYKNWDYCFCIDYRRKYELSVIMNDFNDFEELIRENLLSRHFY